MMLFVVFKCATSVVDIGMLDDVFEATVVKELAKELQRPSPGVMDAHAD
jgi:hypothetical protein